ncbi:zinc finger protein 888 [Bombyx mori]|uniref:Uncharacterized protein n=1 Tax=Bombyx mori TaxID=7091 RepID=A0A8R2M8X1_BOMMO|nr:zinc finger protein 888 [Bombyx mori]
MNTIQKTTIINHHCEMAETKSITNFTKCRICLKEGGIPIYGPDCSTDLSYDVRTFGDIDISEDDEFPKYLCSACYKLLQCAILFRKAAKQSEILLSESILKNSSVSVSEFSCSTESDEPQNDYCENNANNDRPTQWSSVQQYFLDLSNCDLDNIKLPVCLNLARGKKVQCRICKKVVSKGHSRDHYAIHDSTLPKYICHICGKSFRQQSAHANHRFTHSTDFKFKCKICPYRGRSSSLLKGHMKTHTGDYRYLCTECPARFLTKSNLNRHSLRHKESAFKCDTCKKAFHSKLYLQRHYEVDHLGVKNYSCNLCGKAFGYRKQMRRHQIDVHKQEKKSPGRMPSYLNNKLNADI